MAKWKEFLDRFHQKEGKTTHHSLNAARPPAEISADEAIPRRALSEQEMSWVREMIAANPEWSGIPIGQLYVIAKCPCGECRSVKFERPSAPQNPAWMNWAHGETSFLRFGFPVGSVHIQAENHGLVVVHLFTDGGFLDWLDVVSFEFKPLPETIQELSREVVPE